MILPSKRGWTALVTSCKEDREMKFYSPFIKCPHNFNTGGFIFRGGFKMRYIKSHAIHMFLIYLYFKIKLDFELE